MHHQQARGSRGGRGGRQNHYGGGGSSNNGGVPVGDMQQQQQQQQQQHHHAHHHGYARPPQQPYAPAATYPPPHQAGYARAPYGGGGNNGYGGMVPRGGGPGGGKPPVKVAHNIVFNPGMLCNAAKFAKPEEMPSDVSASTLGVLPSDPTRVRVFTGDLSGNLRQFEWMDNTWRQTFIIRHDGAISFLFFCDVWLFAACTPRGGGMSLVKAYNLQTQTSLDLVAAGLPVTHTLPVRAMCVLGPNLVTAGDDGHIKVWQLTAAAWNLLGEFGVPPHTPQPQFAVVVLRSVGDLLVSGTAGGEMKTWRLASGPLHVSAIQAHVGSISAIDHFSTAGGAHYVLSSGLDDYKVRLWKLPSLESPAFTPLHEVHLGGNPAAGPNPLTAMKLVSLGDKQCFFAGFRNGTAMMYYMCDEKNFEKLGVLDGHQRKQTILLIDAYVPAQMLCIVTNKGDMNWFKINPW